MKKVILKFKTPHDLWEFKTIAKPVFVQIHINDCTLICECTEADIKLALEKFTAQKKEEKISF